MLQKLYNSNDPVCTIYLIVQAREQVLTIVKRLVGASSDKFDKFCAKHGFFGMTSVKNVRNYLVHNVTSVEGRDLCLESLDISTLYAILKYLGVDCDECALRKRVQSMQTYLEIVDSCTLDSLVNKELLEDKSEKEGY